VHKKWFLGLLGNLSELDVGELIHGEHFNLFEAMSALEVCQH